MTMKGKGKPVLPMLLADNETLMECPYNMAHQVINKRMMTHLIKCRRNYAQDCERDGEIVLMLVCKYNSSHKVPSPEILSHERACEDQYNRTCHTIEYFDPQTKCTSYTLCYTTCGTLNKKIEPKPIIIKEKNEILNPGLLAATTWTEEEDWGNNPTSSYNPSFKLQSQVIYKYPQMLTKSQRKEWRDRNVEKAQKLETGGLFRSTATDDDELEEQDNKGPNRYFKYKSGLEKESVSGAEGGREDREPMLIPPQLSSLSLNEEKDNDLTIN